jgi:hypothetical protein
MGRVLAAGLRFCARGSTHAEREFFATIRLDKELAPPHNKSPGTSPGLLHLADRISSRQIACN